MASAPVQFASVQTRLQVAAIDFGTTFSGYAFSFRTDFENDPLSVRSFNWQTASGCLSSLKTSSSILFNPNQKFHSFGFEAEQNYAELAAEEQHGNYYFFRRFKMLLYKQKKLNRMSLLHDDKGLSMNAMTVFTACIRYLKDHLLEHATELEPSEIHWVLTVPAIWEDAAKQFMREAAVAAGIQSENLSLALEPEAASLYCRHLPLNRLKCAEEDTSYSCFEPGTRYLVLDAGGGTVDITVHETKTDGNVKEIYKANGGPWGGTTVDDAFRTFLVDILTDEVLQDVLKYHQDDYLEVFREFEIKKRTFDTEKDQATFKLPLSFFEAYRKIHERDLSIKESLSRRVKLSSDKVRADAQIIRRFFDPTCVHIVQHLRDIFKMSPVQGTNAILMVGGFSESVLLQHAVRKAFPDKRVIVPEEAGLAVVKGAVIFGHNPLAIVTRVARYTYGVNTYNIFNPEIHPRSRLVVIDGIENCQGCFDKHVKVGQPMRSGMTFETKTYFPASKRSTGVSVQVYRSTKERPRYVEDPSCKFIGKVDIDLSDIAFYRDRAITVKIIYGEPELGLEVRVTKTGQLVKAKFNFLGI